MVFWTRTGNRVVSNHDKCQNRANCTGPGCRLQTGKTARKRASRSAA